VVRVDFTAISSATGRRGLEIGTMLFTPRNLKPLTGFETNQLSDEPVGFVGYFVMRALW
jgi:hypothetical protein